MVTTQGNTVEFRFFRTDAKEVFLVGDFVDWQPHHCPMQDTGRGEWIARLRLPPGEYKFRYLADGQWFTDYAAFGVEYGPFGFDSLVRVAAARRGRACPKQRLSA